MDLLRSRSSARHEHRRPPCPVDVVAREIRPVVADCLRQTREMSGDPATHERGAQGTADRRFSPERSEDGAIWGSDLGNDDPDTLLPAGSHEPRDAPSAECEIRVEN